MHLTLFVGQCGEPLVPAAADPGYLTARGTQPGQSLRRRTGAIVRGLGARRDARGPPPGATPQTSTPSGLRTSPNRSWQRTAARKTSCTMSSASSRDPNIRTAARYIRAAKRSYKTRTPVRHRRQGQVAGGRRRYCSLLAPRKVRAESPAVLLTNPFVFRKYTRHPDRPSTETGT